MRVALVLALCMALSGCVSSAAGPNLDVYLHAFGEGARVDLDFEDDLAEVTWEVPEYDADHVVLWMRGKPYGCQEPGFLRLSIDGRVLGSIDPCEAFPLDGGWANVRIPASRVPPGVHTFSLDDPWTHWAQSNVYLDLDASVPQTGSHYIEMSSRDVVHAGELVWGLSWD